MYTIGICDDDKYYLDIINSNILEFAKLMNIGVDIYKFESGQDFLNTLTEASNHFDIIFLDIDMPFINGLETAEKLRTLGIESLLIFVTSMEDKVFDAFGYDALRFVLKRNLKADFQNAFIKAIDVLNQTNKVFSFKTSEGLIKLPINEILYFIFEDRKVKVICHNKLVYILNSVTLLQIEELVSQNGFVPINRYVIVNVKYVSGINKNCLTMDNGDYFDISRPKLKDVYKVIADYIR